MTNLKNLTKSLNLEVLNSAESMNLKGGRRAKAILNLGMTTPTKPVAGGGGAGLPPRVDSIHCTF